MLFASYRPSTKEENPGTYNDYTQDGLYASQFAHYEMPKVTFSLTGTGSICNSFRIVIFGKQVELKPEATSAAVQIGTVEESTTKRAGTYQTTWGSHECEYTYKTMAAKPAGEGLVTTITATYGDSTYTITLQTPLSIVQRNTTVPRVTLNMSNNPEGVFVTPTKISGTDGSSYSLNPVEGEENQVVAQREDGRSFTIILPDLTTESGKHEASFASRDDVKPTETVYELNGVQDPELPGMTDQLPDVKSVNLKELDCTVKYLVMYDQYRSIGSGGRKDERRVKDDNVAHSKWGTDRASHFWAYLRGRCYIQRIFENSPIVCETRSGTVTRIETTRTNHISATYTFAGWQVDGESRILQPGERCEVSGNVQIRPVFTSKENVFYYTVETVKTEGYVRYTSTASVTGETIERVKFGNENWFEPSEKSGTVYCAKSSCSKNATGKSSEDAAQKAAQQELNSLFFTDSDGNEYRERIDYSVNDPTAADPVYTAWKTESTFTEGNKKTTETKDYNPDGTVRP